MTNQIRSHGITASVCMPHFAVFPVLNMLIPSHRAHFDRLRRGACRMEFICSSAQREWKSGFASISAGRCGAMEDEMVKFDDEQLVAPPLITRFAGASPRGEGQSEGQLQRESLELCPPHQSPSVTASPQGGSVRGLLLSLRMPPALCGSSCNHLRSALACFYSCPVI